MVFTEAVYGSSRFIGECQHTLHAKTVISAFFTFGKPGSGVKGNVVMTFIFYMNQQMFLGTVDFHLSSAVPFHSFSHSLWHFQTGLQSPR